MPVPGSNLLERRNSVPSIKRKINCPQLSPALYATPKPTPLPGSPSSFSPSPYIVNHKRRGPRLLKSFSEDNVASHTKDMDDDRINAVAENEVIDSTKRNSVTSALSDSIEQKKQANGVQDSPVKEEIPNGEHLSRERGNMDGLHSGEVGSRSEELKSRTERSGLAMEKDTSRPVALNSEIDGALDDFLDPRESMSYASKIDGEDNSAFESFVKLSATTPAGEFYDAWEELSSDGGLQSSVRDIEAESREMRLNLSMEIERRKQAEETLNNLQSHWLRIRQQLALAGLTLPACPFALSKGELSPDSDYGEDLCQQVYLARFVSDSIGRGIAKAQVEMDKEAQIEAKNFEIARLWDRLHYYEVVNQEISQRNQEAVEMARRNRHQLRRRKQRWVWGTIATVITLGTAALAWSYLPTKESPSSTPDHDD